MTIKRERERGMTIKQGRKGAASERREDTSKGFKDLYLNAKARIWP
jgi:hypothetical protein